MGDQVPNPRHEALERLKTYVLTKNETLGFESPTACYAPGFTYSSKVNAEDTWTGPLADDEASDTSTDVTNLANVFTGLTQDIEAALFTTAEYVDADDPAADWPQNQ